MDSQVASTKLPVLDERQGVLLLRRKVKAKPNTAPVEMVRSRKNYGEAFTLACMSSGLSDEEIGETVGIDAGYFSKMKKGRATLQGDLVAGFCDCVGNRILPDWQAFQLGCVLVEIESETQRQLRAERTRADKAEEKNRIYEDLLIHRRSA